VVPFQLDALLAALALSSRITTDMNVTRLIPTQLTANVTSAWLAATTQEGSSVSHHHTVSLSN
jgi:hypothetical protein